MKKSKQLLKYIIIWFSLIFFLYLIVDFLVFDQGIFRKKKVTHGYVNNLLDIEGVKEIEKLANFPMLNFPSKGKIFYNKTEYPIRSVVIRVFGFVYCDENKIKKYLSNTKFNEFDRCFSTGTVPYMIPKESGWAVSKKKYLVRNGKYYYKFENLVHFIYDNKNFKGGFVTVTFVIDPKDGKFTGELIKGIR
jgi:hypothetical protein